jgi:hypothetical protein
MIKSIMVRFIKNLRFLFSFLWKGESICWFIYLSEVFSLFDMSQIVYTLLLLNIGSLP